jgi:hypothetical protein
MFSAIARPRSGRGRQRETAKAVVAIRMIAYILNCFAPSWRSQ